MSNWVHYVGEARQPACGVRTDKPGQEAQVCTSVKSMVTCWRCIHQLLGWELPKPPETPEHDKLKAAKGPRGDDTQLVGEFLAWLDDQGVRLARYNDSDELYEINEKRKLLSEFFEVDDDTLSDEKDLLLDYQRAFNKAVDRAQREGRECLSKS